jgi:hypothetical protein
LYQAALELSMPDAERMMPIKLSHGWSALFQKLRSRVLGAMSAALAGLATLGDVIPRGHRNLKRSKYRDRRFYLPCLVDVCHGQRPVSASFAMVLENSK